MGFYNGRKDKRRDICLFVGLFIVIFIPIALYNIVNFTSFNNHQNRYYIDDKEIFSTKISGSEPNGAPLLIHQYANVSNSEFPNSFPTNISFTLAQGWETKNISIEYEGVSYIKDRVVNGDFPTDLSDWNFKTNKNNNFSGVWEGEDPRAGISQVIADTTSYNKTDYGYLIQNLSLNEGLSNKLATLSIDTHCKGVTEADVSLYMAISINEKEVNKTIPLNYILEEQWQTQILQYDPIEEGQELPGNITIKVGVWVNSNTTTGKQIILSLDNIKFNLWTEPNQPNLAIANDVGNIAPETNYTYINTSYGKGYSFINTEYYSDITKDIKFSIYTNFSGVLDSSIDQITIHSIVMKEFNSTYSENPGSFYSTNNEILWETDFQISNPSEYQIYIIEIFKPVDWNITNIRDSYDEERLKDCSGTDLGSNKTIIPEFIIQTGLWHLEAKSNNYITNANIGVWNGFSFLSQTELWFMDLFQVNFSLDNSITPENTQINSTIYYPNGSLFLTETETIDSYNIQLGNYTVGSNMIVGTYQVHIIWANDQSYLSKTQLGFRIIFFDVIHNTSLTVINPFIEAKKGEPVLLKVKYWDVDINDRVRFASVRYNSSYGTNGDMLYQGGGQYIAEIDTSSLNETFYYFSFIAKQDYYQTQNKTDLIQLNIIYQSLKLEVPKTTLSASGNNYFSCEINVTGLDSGSLIPGANISTDWENEPAILEYEDGKFVLNFSTANYPKSGGIETQSIQLFANKTGYGDTSEFIYVTITPVVANLNVSINGEIINQDQSIEIYFREELEINCTVYAFGEKKYVSNGTITLIAENLERNFTEFTPNNYSLTVSINPINFEPGLNFVKLVFEKDGYEDFVFGFQIDAKRIGFQINPVNFETSIITESGKDPLIRVQLIDSLNNESIENATFTYSWDFGYGQLTEVSEGIYETQIDLPTGILSGSFEIKFLVSKNEFYEIKQFSYILVISEPPPSNINFWVIVVVLFIIVGVASSLLLRTYVYIPRKEAKEKEFQEKIQPFKDARNIIGINIIHKDSGLSVYFERYSYLKDIDQSLFSGFIQAIMIFGREIGKEKKKEKGISKRDLKVAELDFKYFYTLLCDYKELRILLILRNSASDNLKNKLSITIKHLYSKISVLLQDFAGNLKPFGEKIAPVLNENLNLFYKHSFKITSERKYYNKIKAENLLSKMETRVLNVIEALTQTSEIFDFSDVFEFISEKNEDLVIEGFMSLFHKRMIVPVEKDFLES